MSELKINDERNMHNALKCLNLFLSKKERSYFFKVVYNTNTLDLILVKEVINRMTYIDTDSIHLVGTDVDNLASRGFVEKYILSTETPLRMGAEITKIHTLLFNIL